MHAATTEIQIFHQFLGERLSQFGADFTPEDAVQEFRAYQEELERCRREVELAVEQSRRGESRPLDMGALKAEVRRRLAEKGISD
jgi:hypothetical protein